MIPCTVDGQRKLPGGCVSFMKYRREVKRPRWVPSYAGVPCIRTLIGTTLRTLEAIGFAKDEPHRG